MTAPSPPDTHAAAAALRRAAIPGADALARLAEPSIRITARKAQAELPLGASRFGGAPDVPARFDWPTRRHGPLGVLRRPLTFLAQLDLGAIRAPGLPASGWLLFFYDAVEQPWGFDPKDAGGARVIHVDVPRDRLARRAHPAVKETGGPFEACALSFAPALDLPSLGDHVAMADAGVELTDAQWDAYDQVAAALSGVEKDAGAYHHLLGNPQTIQGDMRAECQLVTSGIYTGDPSGYEGERAKALLRTASAEWRLLLQLDTDEEGPGWMWGDAGRLYFWIRRSDLAARAFEKAWVVLQCY
jgi:uncharacterized protein YwqG